MATIDLGKVAFTHKGTYNSGTTYEDKDCVQYTDGDTTSTFVYINSTSAANQTPSTGGTVNTTYWSLMAKGQPQTADLTPVKADIQTLALHSAVADNKAAYNLTNSFIDQFEDSTGILTNTNVTRIGEYFASVYTVEGDANTILLLHGDDTGLTDSSDNNFTPNFGSGGGVARSSAQSKFGSYSMYCDGSSNSYIQFKDIVGTADAVGTGDFTVDCWVRFDNVANGARIWSIGNEGTVAVGATPGSMLSYGIWSANHNFMQRIGGTDSTWSFNSTNPGSNTWVHTAYQRTSGTSYAWLNGNVINTSSTHGSGTNMETSGASIGDFSVFARHGSATEIVAGYVDELRYSNISRYTGQTSFTPPTAPYTSTATNATGQLICNAQTANAATTKVSGTILYKNNAGTAALNTDLVCSFSADNGSNWTQTTMTPGGTFSTGILIAKCPEVTVTSGTQVKYKIDWANQASGTKETQLHGVALTY